MAITNYDNVLLLLPMSGSDNGVLFPEWSVNNAQLTVYSGVKTLTNQSKYYGSSAYFDGASDSLGVPASCQLSGSGSYTIEFWMRIPSLPGSNDPIISQFSSGSSNFDIEVMTDGKLRFYMGDAGVYYTSTSAVAINTWVHVALQNTSGTLKFFMDGIEEVSVSNSMTWVQSVNNCRIGVAYNGTGSGFNGWLQDFCIKQSSNGYTTGFTPPVAHIGVISGNVKDSTGANAIRSIVAFPRTTPTRAFSSVSDSSGNYSIAVPATECARVVLDNAVSGTIYNDLIDRVIAQ